MKKGLIIFAFLGIVFSCGNQPRVSKVDAKTHLESYIDDFRSRYPKGLDNDAQREKMNEAFKNEIKDSLSNNPLFLIDYPVKCKSVLNNSNDTSLCYVHFQSWIHPDDFEFKNINLNEVGFDIVASVSSRYIDSLKENEYYYVKGKLIDFITLDLFKTYTNSMAFTPLVGISPEIGVSDWFNVSLGMMLYEIEGVEPYNHN